MASYVHDCNNLYVDLDGDNTGNTNYTTYSTPEAAKANCLSNATYYTGNPAFTNYNLPGRPCAQSSWNEDGNGYVSDGNTFWYESTPAQNQEGSTATLCNPDCLSSGKACKIGQPWPLLQNQNGANYQLYEGFELFDDKKKVDMLMLILLLCMIGGIAYYLVTKKK